VDVRCGDANRHLASIDGGRWDGWRAVAFLDPYGMQVNWSTLESIAGTRAVDLWLLVPLSIGPARMLQQRASDLDRHAGWRRRLDAFFGTSDWESEFYRPGTGLRGSAPQPSLFGDVQSEQERYRIDSVIDRLESYYVQRLKGTFPFVSERPRILRNSRGQPLYMLCFAVANPSPRAATVALRIANHLLAPDA
jgi:three-Cys-motif partner protein